MKASWIGVAVLTATSCAPGWPAPGASVDPGAELAGAPDGADYVVRLRIVTWRALVGGNRGVAPGFVREEWCPDIRGPSGFQRLEPAAYLDGAAPDGEVEKQLARRAPGFVFTVVASASARARGGSPVALQARTGGLLDLVGAPMWLEAKYAATPEEPGPDGYLVLRLEERWVNTNITAGRGTGPPVELKVGGTYRFCTWWAQAEGPSEDAPPTNCVPGHFMLVTIAPA